MTFLWEAEGNKWTQTQFLTVTSPNCGMSPSLREASQNMFDLQYINGCMIVNIKNINFPVNVIPQRFPSFTLSWFIIFSVFYLRCYRVHVIPGPRSPQTFGCCFCSVLFCECVKYFWVKVVWNRAVMHIFQPMSSSHPTPNFSICRDKIVHMEDAAETLSKQGLCPLATLMLPPTESSDLMRGH